MLVENHSQGPAVIHKQICAHELALHVIYFHLADYNYFIIHSGRGPPQEIQYSAAERMMLGLLPLTSFVGLAMADSGEAPICK